MLGKDPSDVQGHKRNNKKTQKCEEPGRYHKDSALIVTYSFKLAI